MAKFVPILIMLCAASLVSCNSDESERKAKNEIAKSKTFADVTFLELRAVADGGAYASDGEGGVWYLKGGEAIRVREVNRLSIEPTSLLKTGRERYLWISLQREIEKVETAEAEKEKDSDETDYSDQR